MSHYGTGALGSRLSVLAVVARRPVEDTAGISHRWDPDPSYDAAMGELWPGTAARPFVDNACGGPYLRMGPAARLSAPRLCARLCNISGTEPALGIEACGRRRSPVQGHSTGERIAARACTVYRKCVGVPDRDVHTGMSRLGCPDRDVLTLSYRVPVPGAQVRERASRECRFPGVKCTWDCEETFACCPSARLRPRSSERRTIAGFGPIGQMSRPSTRWRGSLSSFPTPSC